ncbi:FG-GAP-like repeat-containing protein [Phaeovulum sp.]|uniref:FG-GAP-like repeat-containing protein n=1 Tax=Phaeovulum sp. TaxID=2934796 RepID=UPI0039E33FAE
MFWHRATHFAGFESYVCALTDLEISVQGGNVLLYGATGTGGGFSAFRLIENGAATFIAGKTINADLGHLAPPQVEVIATDSGYFGLSLGMNISGINAFKLDATGGFGGRQSIDLASAPLTEMLAATQAEIAGRSFLYVAKAGQLAPAVFETGLATGPSLISGASDTSAGGFGALATVQIGNQHVLIGVNGATGMVRSYRIAANGTLQTADTLTTESGIGFQTPTNVVSAVLNGQSYAIVGASGSSSLTVLRIGADGTMTATDHIVDSLETRFQGVTALRSFSVEGRVYVLAGGGDDGLSLFTLLPTGQLIHLTTLADSAAMTLADVSALAVWVQNDGKAQVFVGSASETGITQLLLDLGPSGLTQMAGGGTAALTGGSGSDMLVAADTDIDLKGLAGDDILVAGAGAARLWGGAGADTFVLGANGKTNQIMDFQPGLDLIDLTLMPLLRSAAQLEIRPTMTGATISYLGTTVVLHSAAGTSINLMQVMQAVRLPFARYDPTLDYERLFGIAFDENTGTVKHGTSAGDIFHGGAGIDRLEGNGGNDILSGGGNDDMLVGGIGNDILTGGTLGYLAPVQTVANFGVNAGGWVSQDETPRLLAEGVNIAAIIGFGNRGTYLSAATADGSFTKATFAVDNFGRAQGWVSYDEFPRLVGDFNGDGLDDIVGFGKRGAYIAYADDSGGFGPAKIAVQNLGAQQGWVSFDRYPRIIGDINGDGLDDLIGFGHRGTYVALAKPGGGFGDTFRIVANFSVTDGWGSNDRYFRTSGDLNGDGFADIIGFGRKGTYVALSDGAGGLGPAQLLLDDFGTNQGWTSNNNQQRMVVDLNGDGLDDIIGFDAGTTSVALSLGGGRFHPLQTFAAEGRDGWAGHGWEPRFLADMNGDGIMDIVTFTKTGVTVALGLPDADIFIFDDGFGRDRITDFDAANPDERIDFSAHSALDSYAKVLAAMTQVGDDVIITAGADVLTLENVWLGAMGADDFIF